MNEKGARLFSNVKMLNAEPYQKTKEINMPVFSTNIGTPMKSDKNKFCFVCKKQFDSHDILCVTDKNGKQKLYHQICYDTSPTEKYKELNED